MTQLIGIDNNLLVQWTLLRNTGKPFPVNEYAIRIFVNTPRGRNEIEEFNISGADNNIVSWQMNNRELRFLGNASLRMSIIRRGQQIATVEERDAFTLSRRSPKGCDHTQIVNVTSFVNVLHPELVADQVAVLFPSFEVDENLHLWLHGSSEAYASNFMLDENGHLRFVNND